MIEMSAPDADSTPSDHGRHPQRSRMKHAIHAIAHGNAPKGFTPDELVLLKYVSSRWSDLRVSDPYSWLADVWFGKPGHVCDSYDCAYRNGCVTRFCLEDNHCENPYLEAFRVANIKARLFDDLNYRGVANSHAFFNRYETAPGLERRALVDEYSWAIPNDAALHAIATCGPIVEVGAGGGYWAWGLRRMGADIIATDPNPAPSTTNTWCKRPEPWTEIEMLSAAKAAHRYYDRALFMCWPPLGREKGGNYANRCMKAYHRAGGKTLIYGGERGNGCTGGDPDERQWRMEPEAVEIPQWPGIHDDLTIWRRR